MSGPIFADRVKQTSTTTGTGTLSLGTTIASGYKSFVSQVGTGNTCYFCIVNQSADEWEIAQGTATSGSPDTLSRTTVLASSTGSAVSFSAGTKDVFLVAPAVYGTPLLQMPTTFATRVAKENALSATVGNARGTGAVDLQIQRNAAAKVASGSYSTIAGGLHNTSSGTGSFVGGGGSNTSSGNKSTVAGGQSCTSDHNYATIGGGYANLSQGLYSTVAGGSQNRATANNSFVGGGNIARATGASSVVCGGVRNYASANYSAIVGGSRSTADKIGQHTQAMGMFSAAGDAQTSVMVLRKQTTNATQSEMFLDGSSARMTLANDTTWGFNISVVARRTDANDESAYFYFQGAIDRNATAATTAVVGAVTKTVVARDTVTWDVDVNADTTNGALRIQVTGDASKTINWVAQVRIVETTG